MKTQTQNSNARNLSARWTHAESETLVPMADRKCFGDVTGWSRATVWFKRPDDVKQIRISHPVSNLQSLTKPSKAPIAQAESICMTGKFAGIVTENKRGERANGESANDIATALEKRFAAYVTKAQPSHGELAEVAYLRACKSKETKARLAFLAKAIKAKR